MRKMSGRGISEIVLTIVVVILAGGIAPRAIAKDGNAKEKEAIRAVIAEQAAAWNKGDIDSFMKTYENSPETTFVGGASVNKGYGQVLERYKKNYSTRAMMGTLSFREVEIRVLPSSSGTLEYALVTGRFHLDRTEHGSAGKGKDDGIFSLVFHKTAAGWKIVMDHTA